MTGKTRMVQIHTVPVLRGLGWRIKVNGKNGGWFGRQQDAEDCATLLAKLMPAATVKFHKRDGTIRNEATYPRSRDPKKTPG